MTRLRHMERNAWRIAGGCGLIAALCLTGRTENLLISAAVLGSLGGIFAISAWILRRQRARSTEPEIQLSGEILAHWTYSRGDWRRFAREEWRRRYGEPDRIANVVALVCGVLFGAPFYWIYGWKGPAVALAAALAFVFGVPRFRRWFEGWPEVASQAVIQSDGVLFNDYHQKWRRSDGGLRLLAVGFEHPATRNDIALLEFSATPSTAWTLASQTGQSSALYAVMEQAELRVPVPRGREDEASAIVEGLRARIATARLAEDRDAD